MQNKKIDAFVQYFRNGCKEKHTGTIGMEIEHFVIDRATGSAVSYYGEKGIEALLERLSCCGQFQEKDIRDGHLIALGSPNYVISIEPAAQLEVSIVPQDKLEKIETVYRLFREAIEPVLEEWGYNLVTCGYVPGNKVTELSLIPKLRYRLMDSYFEKIGMYGRCMMRGTASVQCAIDYYSEEDFVRTYRMAAALGPLLALVTDNADVFEGEPWTKHMVRTLIWEGVDKDRCGIVPGTFEDGFGFEAYGTYVCQVPEIFADSGQNVVEHLVSMVFPDVRLKQYMEIRVADSMPVEYALSYGALVKGLFQDRDKLYELYKEFELFVQSVQLQQHLGEEGKASFGKKMEEEVTVGKQQLIKFGYDGKIFGKEAACWLDKMVRLAEEQLSKEEKNYLLPMKMLVQNRQSVRDVPGIEHLRM